MQASNYLNKLAELSRDDEGKKNKDQCKTKWRSLISIQLQRNLANVIADKLYSIHRMNTTIASVGAKGPFCLCSFFRVI